MRLEVKRASTWDIEKVIEVNTLEEFLDFIKQQDDDVIIENSGKEISLLIYDDYIE